MLAVGVHARSPLGDGATATFSGVELLDTPVGDDRSGE
jgi:hypothetical protein